MAPVTATLLLGGLVLGAFGDVQARSNLDVSFPLTPALSLGERENRSPRLAEADTLGRSDVLVSEPAKRGVEVNSEAISQRRTHVLPLHQGEGRGEGGGTARPPSVMLLAQASPGEAPSTKTAAKQTVSATPVPAARIKEAAVAESVIQEIRVEEKFALATVKLRWQIGRASCRERV